MLYQVLIAKSAQRELQRLPSKNQERILSILEKLQEEPRPRGSIKLRGSDHLRRIRSGDYRIIYSVHDEQKLIDVSAIRHRSDAYR